jgi:hypothetical protein
VSPWTQNLHTWSPTPQSGRFGSCAASEACKGSCELRLFCSNFDRAFTRTLACVFFDLTQVLREISDEECLCRTLERPRLPLHCSGRSTPSSSRTGSRTNACSGRWHWGRQGERRGERRCCRSQDHVGPGFRGRAGGARGGRGLHHRVGLRRLRRCRGCCRGRNLAQPLSWFGRVECGARGGRNM